MVFGSALSILGAFFTGGVSLLAKKGKPKVPDEGDTAEARRKREEELSRRQGRGASIVTGGAGLTNEPTLGKPSLLGPS